MVNKTIARENDLLRHLRYILTRRMRTPAALSFGTLPSVLQCRESTWELGHSRASRVCRLLPADRACWTKYNSPPMVARVLSVCRTLRTVKCYHRRLMAGSCTRSSCLRSLSSDRRGSEQKRGTGDRLVGGSVPAELLRLTVPSYTSVLYYTTKHAIYTFWMIIHGLRLVMYALYLLGPHVTFFRHR